MLCLILIVGGLLIMMGQHDRSEALFYYFRLEDQVPETHLLRLIEKYISFAFVREKLKASYSDTGRPSIDPELLLRILLIGYLYGITSERKLVEELRMHLAWRWFTGLGFDQEIPHHSTFSKNRHGRFQESKLFEQMFEQIVRQCVEVDWRKASIYRWTADSWRPMLPRRVAFHASSWRRRHRCTTPCASICKK
jgi:transposase